MFLVYPFKIGVGTKLQLDLCNFPCNHFCKYFEKLFLINFFLRFRTSIAIKFLNKFLVTERKLKNRKCNIHFHL